MRSSRSAHHATSPDRRARATTRRDPAPPHQAMPAAGETPSPLASPGPPVQLAARRHQWVVLAVADPSLHQDDPVVGDLDVLRGELVAAPGDVAQPDALMFLGNSKRSVLGARRPTPGPRLPGDLALRLHRFYVLLAVPLVRLLLGSPTTGGSPTWIRSIRSPRRSPRSPGPSARIAALAHATQLRRQTDRPRPADRGRPRSRRAPVAPADRSTSRYGVDRAPEATATANRAALGAGVGGIRSTGSSPTGGNQIRRRPRTPNRSGDQWWLNKRNKADRNSSPVQRQGRR